MRPVSLSTYLADAHRHDLLCEARQAALAAEATSKTGGIWSAALLVGANQLLRVGHQLRAHVSHKRLARAHGTPCGVASMCHCDAVPCHRFVSLGV